jgi:hypothetical protein
MQHVSSTSRTTKIIAGGFLVRAFLGQALFWISYLRLPIARSLQIGDGFWFFAADGPEYLALANGMVHEGLLGIFTIGGKIPAHLFVRLVAILAFAFGSVASLAILINCAAYALTCALLVRMKANDVVLAAVAFSPAAMLFSLQLLKDTLFCFLIVLMVFVFRRWQELWQRDAARGPILACAASMFAAVLALSGIRWYVAAIVWGASAIFFVLVSRSARRRGVAIAAGAVLFVLLSQAVRLGSFDLPPQIARLLDPATMFASKPAVVTNLVGKARRNFDKSPGATTIAPGPLAPRQTFAARVVTGFSATFVPRFVAQPLGLVQIGGGRGFWLFAELDTIVFDLVLFYAMLCCARALRGGFSRAAPLFVFLALVFVFTSVPMIYAVNNFGTLFRLRQMLFIMLAVIPITLRSRTAMSNAGNVD